VFPWSTALRVRLWWSKDGYHELAPFFLSDRDLVPRHLDHLGVVGQPVGDHLEHQDEQLDSVVVDRRGVVNSAGRPG